MSNAKDSKKKSQEIPEAIVEIFGVKDEEPFATSEKIQKIKQKMEMKKKKPISRLAGKSLIELTKELQKVRLEKGEIIAKNYSEEQNGITLALYGVVHDLEAQKRLDELIKLENELMVRIEELKNAT